MEHDLLQACSKNNEAHVCDCSSAYQLHIKSSKIRPDDNNDEEELMLGSVASMLGDVNTLAI